MATPNHSHIVRQVDASYPELLKKNDRASVVAFMIVLGQAMVKHDNNWGYLSKKAEEKHIIINGSRVAEDAIIYKDEKEAVDVILGADNHPHAASPNWGIIPIRSSSGWVRIDAENDPPQDIAKIITELKLQVATLRLRCDFFEEFCIKYNDRIALEMDRGKLICAEHGGPTEDNQPIEFTSRTAIGSWETLVVRKP